MAIAASLYFSRLFATHSGGCLNPGIATGLSLFKALADGMKWGILNKLYIYLIGPFTGAIISGLTFRFVYQRFTTGEIGKDLINEKKEKEDWETKINFCRLNLVYIYLVFNPKAGFI